MGVVIGVVLATAPDLTALTPAQEEAERIRRQDQDYQRGIEQRERQRARQEERAKKPC
jgi:hypothetical protein